MKRVAGVHRSTSATLFSWDRYRADAIDPPLLLKWIRGCTMCDGVMLLLLLGSLGRTEVPPEIRFEFQVNEIPFRFDNGARGRHDLPEIMGGGVGLIDCDGDGFLDLFLCQGGPIVPDPGRVDPPCQLFRNNGDRTFTDITGLANAPGPSYAMGVAVGDYDSDGHDDLFVTGWREQRLYRNLGGGHFRDETERAGVGSQRWSTSATFCDLDGDGDLDLYVGCYVRYAPEDRPITLAPDGKADYAGPEDFRPEPGHSYRNNGDATFSDVSKETGLDLKGGRELGVLAANFNGDSRPDLYVAVDGLPCRLYLNRGAWKFEEVGLASGVALDGRGEALAGMGIAHGDIDGDGRSDLLVTNFYGRSTVYFHNDGDGQFSDASEISALTSSTRGVLGFGIGLADFDGDGSLDLIQANGHVLDRERLGEPFAQRPSLLRNRGGRFRDDSGSVQKPVDRPILGRGVAIGDLDNDGRPDAVIASIDSRPLILWNRTHREPGLILELTGKNDLHAVGAKVRAIGGGKVVHREVVSGGSYLSAQDPRISIPVAERIEVTWPSGRVQSWTGLKPGKPIRLRESKD